MKIVKYCQERTLLNLTKSEEFKKFISIHINLTVTKISLSETEWIYEVLRIVFDCDFVFETLPVLKIVKKSDHLGIVDRTSSIHYL